MTILIATNNMAKDKRFYTAFPLKELWKQGMFALSLLPTRSLLVRQFRGYGTILAEDLILFLKLQSAIMGDLC